MKQIRIILADDYPLVRAGILSTLAAEPDLLVLGEASNGDEVRCLCLQHHPDILLLDLSMPGLKVGDTISLLKENFPDTKVIILTAYEDDAYVREMLSLGVRGYILKEEATGALIRAIRVVHQGDTWFSNRVIALLTSRENQQTEFIADSLEKDTLLNDRERDILQCLGEGMSNEEISSHLCISKRTVRHYVGRILEKLDVSNRTKAVVVAVHKGLIQV